MLSDISLGNPFDTITPEKPLIDVVQTMAKGVYRLPVVENGVVSNIVSQWDILLMICSRLSLLGDKFQKQVTLLSFQVDI
jgi:hypothetical protein